MGLAVIDASVAVKWFLEEAETGEALALQSDFFEGRLSLRVPSIFPYEIMNALASSQRFRRAELLEASRDIDRSGFEAVPLFGEYFERSVETALLAGISIYDASYLALAEVAGCPLFTADEELLALGSRDRSVVHIRDYPRIR